MSYLNTLIDSGLVPRPLLALGARYQTRARLAEIAAPPHIALQRKMDFVHQLRTMRIAVETDAANAQHYEVSVGVLAAALGPRMKYSCCLYESGKETLAEAEETMLRDYVEKAELRDGMRILDLGCGWGSGALYYAEKLPGATVVAFSNSKKQREFIEGRAREKGLGNLEVVVGDVAAYEFEAESFDRVVSIEMFEHMKNYKELMAKVARALRPGGKLFVHIFAHKDSPYHFEDGWMTTHFFTGGTMLSSDLLLYFQDDLRIQKHWWLSGKHYAKTQRHWLNNLTANKKEAWPHLVENYGEENAKAWYHRWELFYLACEEFFGYDNGDVFGVAHYLFEKPSEKRPGSS